MSEDRQQGCGQTFSSDHAVFSSEVRLLQSGYLKRIRLETVHYSWGNPCIHWSHFLSFKVIKSKACEWEERQRLMKQQLEALADLQQSLCSFQENGDLDCSSSTSGSLLPPEDHQVRCQESPEVQAGSGDSLWQIHSPLQLWPATAHPCSIPGWVFLVSSLLISLVLLSPDSKSCSSGKLDGASMFSKDRGSLPAYPAHPSQGQQHQSFAQP